jgi:hypothetical protein
MKRGVFVLIIHRNLQRTSESGLASVSIDDIQMVINETQDGLDEVRRGGGATYE